MIKLVVFQFFTIIGFLVASKTMGNDITYSWSDIGIIEQIRIISGLIFIVMVGLAAIVIFRSVWIQRGYQGLDGILVDKEVALFMSHVLAFTLLEIFFFMILFYNYVQPPQYAFWICAGGFLSPEVVRAIHLGLERFKIRKGE